jgi:hypothetical protein
MLRRSLRRPETSRSLAFLSKWFWKLSDNKVSRMTRKKIWTFTKINLWALTYWANKTCLSWNSLSLEEASKHLLLLLMLTNLTRNTWFWLWMVSLKKCTIQCHCSS